MPRKSRAKGGNKQTLIEKQRKQAAAAANQFLTNARLTTSPGPPASSNAGPHAVATVTGGLTSLEHKLNLQTATTLCITKLPAYSTVQQLAALCQRFKSLMRVSILRQEGPAIVHWNRVQHT